MKIKEITELADKDLREKLEQAEEALKNTKGSLLGSEKLWTKDWESILFKILFIFLLLNEFIKFIIVQ